jgi:hypothetical protein
VYEYRYQEDEDTMKEEEDKEVAERAAKEILEEMS